MRQDLTPSFGGINYTERLIDEPPGLRNLAQGRLAVEHEIAGMLHPAAVYLGMGRMAQLVFEVAGEVTLAAINKLPKVGNLNSRINM
jgi:hypothetical protein